MSERSANPTLDQLIHQPLLSIVKEILVNLTKDRTKSQGIPSRDDLDEILEKLVLTQRDLRENQQGLRRWTTFDMDAIVATHDFFLREDYILPLLRQGGLYHLSSGETITDYDETSGTFLGMKSTGQPITWLYHDLFDYLDDEYPYDDIPIARPDIAWLDDTLAYINDATGEVSPLPTERMYVRAGGNLEYLLETNIAVLMRVIEDGMY